MNKNNLTTKEKIESQIQIERRKRKQAAKEEREILKRKKQIKSFLNFFIVLMFATLLILYLKNYTKSVNEKNNEIKDVKINVTDQGILEVTENILITPNKIETYVINVDASREEIYDVIVIKKDENKKQNLTQTDVLREKQVPGYFHIEYIGELASNLLDPVLHNKDITKIVFGLEDDRVTDVEYEVKYKIKNRTRRYKDVGDLKLNFLDPFNSYNKLTVQIIFNKGSVHTKNSKIWGNILTENKSYYSDGNILIDLTQGKKFYEEIYLRVIFPEEYISEMEQINENIEKIITKEENERLLKDIEENKMEKDIK